MPVLQSAPPPLHTVALVGVILACFLAFLPSTEILDEVATADTFTKVLFPEFVSAKVVGWIRLSIGIFMLLVNIYVIMAVRWVAETYYRPESKLKSTFIVIRGLKSHAYFTKWAWALLGVSFLFNGTITLFVSSKNFTGASIIPSSSWWMRLAILIFATAAPTALAVSTVVRYVLWPKTSRRAVVQFMTPVALIQHNLNSFFVLLEIALLGGLPIRMTEICGAPLFAVTYLVFSWVMATRLTDDKKKEEVGPQFVYFFLDTTLGAFTSYALLAILVLFLIFYSICSYSQYVLEHVLGGGLHMHILYVLVICLLVCRFWD